MKMLYFDVETTGLDEKENEIVQIAWIAEDRGSVVHEGSLLIRPRRPSHVDDKALEVQGKTLSDVLNHPLSQVQAHRMFRSYLELFVDKFDKADKFIPCAYNGPFDVGFISRWFEHMGDPYIGSLINRRLLVDPMAIMRWMTALGRTGMLSHKLADTAAYLGVKMEKAHDALSDVRALREIEHRLRLLNPRPEMAMGL